MNNILNNANKYIEIRKIAERKKIDFITARILYNEGNNDISNEDAKEIKMIAKQHKLSYYIIKNILLYGNTPEINVHDIYSIYNYVYFSNEELQKNEEIPKLGLIHNYMEKIRTLVGLNGLTHEEAVKFIELRIKIYSKNQKVSKRVATLAIINDMSKTNAIKYEKVAEFFEETEIELNRDKEKNFHIYLEYSDKLKRKKVHGIKIISKTDKGLSKLEKIINEAFKKEKKDYIKLLEKQAKNCSLIISDYDMNKESYYNPIYQRIFLNTKSESSKELLITFFQETSHFLDYTYGKKESERYLIISSKVRSEFEKIKKTIKDSSLESISQNKNIPSSIRKFMIEHSTKSNLELYVKGLKYFLFTKKITEEYIKDEKLNKKWHEEINKEYPNYSKEDRDLLYRQKLNYERQKYLNLILLIQDIYDGLSKVKINKYFGIYDQEIKHYSSRDRNLIELITKIGTIYNSNGKDVLEYEFGESLAKEIIQIYKYLIESKNNNEVKDNINSETIFQTNKKRNNILKRISNYLKYLQNKTNVL